MIRSRIRGNFTAESKISKFKNNVTTGTLRVTCIMREYRCAEPRGEKNK